MPPIFIPPVAAVSPVVRQFNMIERVSAADNAWQAVAWSDDIDKFCAVANSGAGNRAMTSPDGVTWTIQVMASNDWRGICAGEGLFVAVAAIAGAQCVATSPDGITWTPRNTPSNRTWRAVAYSPSLSRFVAVHSDATASAMYSNDGFTWTLVATPAPLQNNDVIWAEGLGRFYAVAGFTESGMKSVDGITWTAMPMPTSALWAGLAYSQSLGRLVAVGSTGGGNRACYSDDGITWTQTPIGAFGWQSVVWCEPLKLFVAVNSNGALATACATSPDGITWTNRNSMDANQWQSICFSEEVGIAVAVASSGTGDRVESSCVTYTL